MNSKAVVRCFGNTLPRQLADQFSEVKFQFKLSYQVSLFSIRFFLPFGRWLFCERDLVPRIRKRWSAAPAALSLGNGYGTGLHAILAPRRWLFCERDHVPRIRKWRSAASVALSLGSVRVLNLTEKLSLCEKENVFQAC